MVSLKLVLKLKCHKSLSEYWQITNLVSNSSELLEWTRKDISHLNSNFVSGNTRYRVFETFPYEFTLKILMTLERKST